MTTGTNHPSLSIRVRLCLIAIAALAVPVAPEIRTPQTYV